MVTLKDISAACGVSIAAVSRALNDHSDISEDTKQRIREMAERMGYVKYNTERSKTPSHMVGLIVTKDAESFFYYAVILHLWKYLMEQGYDLVLLSPDEEQKREIRRPGYLPRARYLGLDAIILISTLPEGDVFQPQAQNGLRNLLFEDIPVVTIGCSYASFGSVLPDYEEGIRALITYLCNCGCKKILYVYKKKEDADDHLKGLVIRTAVEMGISLKSAECLPGEGSSVRDAYAKTIELFKREKQGPACCILYSDSFLLEGGMEALWHSRIKVPEDVMVASIRVSRANGVCNTVTSWQLQPYDVAKEAAELIFSEIRTPGSAARQTRRVPGALYTGCTTAAERTVGADGTEQTPDAMYINTTT